MTDEDGRGTEDDGVCDYTFHAGGRVADVVVIVADLAAVDAQCSARAFLLKLSAPEIPRLSLAHGRAESKKPIGARGKKEGRERRRRRQRWSTGLLNLSQDK